MTLLRRLVAFTLLVVILVPPAAAEPEVAPSTLEERYAEQCDLASYPQSEPREALTSVVKCIDSDNVVYLLSHLVWPAEVDAKFDGDRTQLETMAARSTAESRGKLVAAVTKHLSEGEWTVGPRTAISRVVGLPNVRLSRLGDRWFMHNVP